MTAANEGNERLVTVHGMGVGDTSNLVVSIAQERGYSVAATGPGQFRMMRQKRPTWAVVAAILTFPFFAIGLLFLLVKKTDTGTVAVFEARDGVKVRFVGGIDDEIVESIASPTSSGAVAAGAPTAPSVDRANVSTGADPPKPMPQTPAPGKHSPQKAPASAASLAAATGSEAPTLIDSSPFAVSSTSPPRAEVSDLDKTVARPSISSTSVGDIAGAFPNGQSVPVANGIVIGRSPRIPAGKDALELVPYPDGSLSKTHLTIEPTSAGVYVTDLHSTNGTVIVESDTRRECAPGVAVAVAVGADVHAGDVVIRIESTP